MNLYDRVKYQRNTQIGRGTHREHFISHKPF